MKHDPLRLYSNPWVLWLWIALGLLALFLLLPMGGAE